MQLSVTGSAQPNNISAIRIVFMVSFYQFAPTLSARLANQSSHANHLPSFVSLSPLRTLQALVEAQQPQHRIAPFDSRQALRYARFMETSTEMGCDKHDDGSIGCKMCARDKAINKCIEMARDSAKEFSHEWPDQGRSADSIMDSFADDLEELKTNHEAP